MAKFQYRDSIVDALLLQEVVRVQKSIPGQPNKKQWIEGKPGQMFVTIGVEHFIMEVDDFNRIFKAVDDEPPVVMATTERVIQALIARKASDNGNSS